MHVTVTDKKDGTARVEISDGAADLVSVIRPLPTGTARPAGVDHDAVLRHAGLTVLADCGYVTCGDWSPQLEGRAWSVSVLPREAGPDPAS